MCHTWALSERGGANEIDMAAVHRVLMARFCYFCNRHGDTPGAVRLFECSKGYASSRALE